MVRLICALIVFWSCFLHADILFEGYSKVTNGGVHIGYSIVRYEFDNKKKQFIATTFMKTNELGGNLTESLKAISTKDLKPVSYSYTSLQGTQTKIIDAKFEKNKIIAEVKEGGQVKKVVNDLPKGAFLSCMLSYVILNGPQGLKADTTYNYKAVAEEDAGIVSGMAATKSVEEFNGVKAYKVLNDFKGAKFINYIAEKGDVLSSKSPVLGIAAELVAQPSLATANFPIPTALLKTLFGDVPTGVKNEITKKHQEQPKSVSKTVKETSTTTAPAQPAQGK